MAEPRSNFVTRLLGTENPDIARLYSLAGLDVPNAALAGVGDVAEDTLAPALDPQGYWAQLKALAADPGGALRAAGQSLQDVYTGVREGRYDAADYARFLPQVMPTPGSGARAPAVLAAKRVKDAPKHIGYDREELAYRYPKTGPSMILPKESGEGTFTSRVLTPEGLAVQKAVGKAREQVKAGNYDPFFPVDQRFYVDPSSYQITGNTLTDAIPKKPATIQKYLDLYGSPDSRNNLLKAYLSAVDDPLSKDWYAVGQLERGFKNVLGDAQGGPAFRTDFADAMAATTGGQTPMANLLTAHYGNYMRARGEPLPLSHQTPYPLGGDKLQGNLDSYTKYIMGGDPLVASNVPKRFNFSANFLGDLYRATMDKQMMRGMVGMDAPAAGSYGVAESVLGDVARQQGVRPANFQDVAWAGFKGSSGKPMIQDVNEALAKTSIVTGLPQDVIFENYVRKLGTLY